MCVSKWPFSRFCGNPPNGNSVAHIKIVNIYLFPKLTRMAIQWTTNLLNCHLAEYTQMEPQIESELFRMHPTFQNTSLSTVSSYLRSFIILEIYVDLLTYLQVKCPTQSHWLEFGWKYICCRKYWKQESIPVGCLPPTFLIRGSAPLSLRGSAKTPLDVDRPGCRPLIVGRPPPYVKRMTDSSENIILPQTSFAGGKYYGWKWICKKMQK